jgi:hypothetical protein
MLCIGMNLIEDGILMAMMFVIDTTERNVEIKSDRPMNTSPKKNNPKLRLSYMQL